MANYRTITVKTRLSENVIRASASVSDMTIRSGVKLSAPVEYSPVPHYGGMYEVTPTLDTQVLATSGMVMDRDVIIRPIPSNYGLITWNGSTLTVS